MKKHDRRPWPEKFMTVLISGWISIPSKRRETWLKLLMQIKVVTRRLHKFHERKRSFEDERDNNLLFATSGTNLRVYEISISPYSSRFVLFLLVVRFYCATGKRREAVAPGSGPGIPRDICITANLKWWKMQTKLKLCKRIYITGLNLLKFTPRNRT